MNEVHQDQIDTEVDWLGIKLQPLLEGKPVSLILLNEKAFGKRKNPLIVITPGSLLGFRKKAVVVSVIDNGSCIVEIDCNSTGKLVLAGIPAKYAKILLEKLQSTYREEHHGNQSPTRTNRRARYTERATRFKSTRKSTCTTVEPRSSRDEH